MRPTTERRRPDGGVLPGATGVLRRGLAFGPPAGTAVEVVGAVRPVPGDPRPAKVRVRPLAGGPTVTVNSNLVEVR